MFKNIFFIVVITVMMTGMISSCVKKDLDTPPIGTLPVGQVYTIGQLIDMYNTSGATQFADTASVYGTVTMDEASGNIYKSAYIQDATGAINLRMTSTSGLRVGDYVRVYLPNTILGTYGGMIQLDNVTADSNIIILANERYIEPEIVSIQELNAGNFMAKLIQLESVQFESGALSLNWADNDGYGERYIENCDGEQVMIRTSNYASFAETQLPQGNGSLVAIASIYNNNWQLLVRNMSEIDLTGERCGGGGAPGEVQGLPYTQKFASSFGTYTTFDVLGNEAWEIDYSTAKMAGYVNNVNYDNEDWLISSPVSLEGVSNVNLSMTYIARYFANLNSDITLQVSTDYIYGSDPATATWTNVPATWVSGSDWTNFATTDIDLSSYAGQTITVAIKYLSTASKAGTIEIQQMTIQ